MNFFEHQAKARSNTGRLVLLFSLAIISLIVITQIFVLIAYAWSQGFAVTDQISFDHAMAELGAETFFGITITIIGIVILAWLYKSVQLASGGRAIAEALNGRLINHDTQDTDEKKILNVVEEMAIASGIAVPPVYVLEEQGINAFAAGYSTKDAIIGITRGCIRSLNRDELQGVIAHEFSHIFNGDMRLNIRLISILHGILVIGMIGHFLMRSSSDSRRYSSRNSRGAVPALMFLGTGLYIIGYAGTFFGKLIKAAVSRQREFLADASAVQFTRNPSGISDALKKIGGFALGSYIHHPESEEFSHLFFNQSFNIRFAGLMATHPPIEERIKRVEPRWQGEFIKVTMPEFNPGLPKSQQIGIAKDSHVFMTTAPAATMQPIEYLTGLTAATALSTTVIAYAGSPTQQHVEEAQQMLQDIPEQLKKLARDTYDVQALIYCLLLDKSRADVLEKQLAYLESKLPVDIYRELMRIKNTVTILAPRHRLPLMDIAITTLKHISQPQYKEFKIHLLALIKADKVIDLQEWSLYRMLSHHLEEMPAAPIGHKSLAALHQECRRLLSAIAIASSENIADARISFQRGWRKLSLPTDQLIEDCLQDMPKLDSALKRSNLLHPLKKPQLIKACCSCLHHELDPEGIELIRTIADNLDVPMPPTLSGQSLS